MEPNLPTKEVWISGVKYIESDNTFPDRAIGILFSNGVIFTVTSKSLSSLLEEIPKHPEWAGYGDAVTNIVMNEQEHWFNDLNPRLTAGLII